MSIQQSPLVVPTEQTQKLQQLQYLQEQLKQQQQQQQQQSAPTTVIVYANSEPATTIHNNELMNIAFEKDPDDPIVVVIKDIVFNLILNIPGLRTKLSALLETPNLVQTEIDLISQLKNDVENIK